MSLPLTLKAGRKPPQNNLPQSIKLQMTIFKASDRSKALLSCPLSLFLFSLPLSLSQLQGCIYFAAIPRIILRK